LPKGKSGRARTSPTRPGPPGLITSCTARWEPPIGAWRWHPAVGRSPRSRRSSPPLPLNGRLLCSDARLWAIAMLAMKGRRIRGTRSSNGLDEGRGGTLNSPTGCSWRLGEFARAPTPIWPSRSERRTVRPIGGRATRRVHVSSLETAPSPRRTAVRFLDLELGTGPVQLPVQIDRRGRRGLLAEHGKGLVARARILRANPVRAEGGRAGWPIKQGPSAPVARYRESASSSPPQPPRGRVWGVGRDHTGATPEAARTVS
jgi:hypothetical protein